MPDVLVEPSVLVGVSSVDGAVSVCRRGLAFSGRTGGGPCRLFAPALVAELVRRTLRRSERRRGWLGRLTAGRILGAILGAELSDIPRHRSARRNAKAQPDRHAPTCVGARCHGRTSFGTRRPEVRILSPRATGHRPTTRAIPGRV